MRLRQLGSNNTEVIYHTGLRVFFSYETPVAAQLANGEVLRADKKWSVTTARHINQWLEGREYTLCPHQRIQELVE